MWSGPEHGLGLSPSPAPPRAREMDLESAPVGHCLRRGPLIVEAPTPGTALPAIPLPGGSLGQERLDAFLQAHRIALLRGLDDA